MSNLISVLIEIQDPNLQLDAEGVDDSHTLKVIHLVQTGECHFPVCKQLMLKKNFRKKKVIVRALKIAGVPTILSIKKQKYTCKP